MTGAAGEAHAIQPVRGAFAGAGLAGEFERQEHVFQRGQRGQQLEGLEDKADAAGAQPGAGVFVEIGESLPKQVNFAGSGQIESGEQPQQRRFARPRRTGNRQRFAGFDLQRNIAEYRKRAGGG